MELGESAWGGIRVDAYDSEQADIWGSVTATGHRDFLVNNGTVQGDIVVNGGTVYTAVSGPEVRGDVVLTGNSPSSSALGFALNTVGGAATGQCAGL